jgi:6-phosphogluconolactonase
MSKTFIYVSNAEDGDISGYTLDRANGTLVTGLRTPAADLVMPLAASPDGGFLYAATRATPFRLFGYRIHPNTGELSCISNTLLPHSMVNLAVADAGNWLLAASYGDNSLSVYRIDEDGSTAVSPSFDAATGASKPHAIYFDDSTRIYVPHLGGDKIVAFQFDPASGNVTAAPLDPLSVPSGSGPRHLVGSSDRRSLYVLNECSGTVTVFKRDEASGHFHHLQSVSSLPDDTNLVPGAPRAPSGTQETALFDLSQAIFCADIHIAPDGRFLYTSERTNSTLSVFAIDQTTGVLQRIETVPTEKHPRSFAIDSSGEFVIVAGYQSSTISLYRIDTVTGTLSLADRADVGHGASWVAAVTVDQSPAQQPA